MPRSWPSEVETSVGSAAAAVADEASLLQAASAASATPPSSIARRSRWAGFMVVSPESFCALLALQRVDHVVEAKQDRVVVDHREIERDVLVVVSTAEIHLGDLFAGETERGCFLFRVLEMAFEKGAGAREVDGVDRRLAGDDGGT